jgi:uncharacterized protein involved in exopolysaccharide biosynthesis
MIALGAFVALGTGPEYRSQTLLVPYRSATNAGGLSGLAGLAGLRLPAGGGRDVVITADLYPDLAQTFDFRSTVASEPIAFTDRDTLLSPVAFFSSEYQPSAVELVAQYTLGLREVIGAAWEESTRDSSGPVVPANAPPRIPAGFERIVRKVGERLSVTTDRRTGIISISAQMPDPVAAASLAQATADRLTEVVIAYEVQKADEQLRFLETQYSESESRYNAAQRALAAFADRNRMLQSATAQIERERLQREVDAAFEVYQQFSREREQARIKRSQDTPVFTVLQRATVPNERVSPRRALIVLVAALIGLLIGCGRIVLWRGPDAAVAPPR